MIMIATAAAAAAVVVVAVVICSYKPCSITAKNTTNVGNNKRIYSGNYSNFKKDCLACIQNIIFKEVASVPYPTEKCTF